MNPFESVLNIFLPTSGGMSRNLASRVARSNAYKSMGYTLLRENEVEKEAKNINCIRAAEAGALIGLLLATPWTIPVCLGLIVAHEVAGNISNAIVDRKNSKKAF